MATLKALADELAQIDAILASGAKSSNADGVNVSFDLDSLRRRRREIQRQLTPGKRPRVSTINLSGQ